MADLLETYSSDCRALANSLVIKFGFQNESVNKRLRELGHYVSEDPSTWKYNLNLAGLYHQIDPEIRVISNDTQEEILFTKEVLANHPRTKSDYRQRNENYYQDLVAEYPLHRTLIKSVTSDITLKQVVEAKDFQIIDWDKSLVADNETSLISRVQKWIDDHVLNNWNPNAIISNPYYPFVFIGAMVQHLPMVIMNIRKELSRTSEAADFYIWSTLGGYYGLDRYKNIFSHEQAMWLYFNIDKISLYLGRQDLLIELIEKLIVNSGLKINEIRLQQNEDSFQDTLEKHSFFHKANILDGSTPSVDTVGTIIRKTGDLALNNKRDQEYDIARVIETGKTTPINDRIVGLIEAEQDGSVVSQTVEMYKKRWDYSIYLASLGIYEPDITVSLPNGNFRTLKLRDAVILYFYAQNNVLGTGTVTIPTITVDWLMPRTYPSFTKLRAFLTDQIPDELINSFLDRKINLEVSNQTDFEQLVADVLTLEFWQELHWESQEGALKRAEVEQLAAALWKSEKCFLAPPGTTYTDWLTTVQINKFDFSDTDWSEIADTILTAITGEELDSGSLPNRQKALLEVLDLLTSYTLRYIIGDTSAKVQNMEIPSIHHEVILDIWIEDHEWPVGQTHDTEDMEEYDLHDLTLEWEDDHIWLEEDDFEYLVQTGSTLYVDQYTGDEVDVDVIGPGGIIIEEL